MSKLAPTSIKYVIRAEIRAKGVIEKPDVIGAIFGQTEGLLGADLDLRELQRTGRIGRIEVNIKSEKGNSFGEIIIPSALDSAETSMIAATLETIERIGPCIATIVLKSVEDTRALKREQVIRKAKDILKNLMDSSSLDTDRISDEIKEEVKTYEITTYKGLPAGPGIQESDEVIIVEGRADVLNLIKFGLKNVIAIEGSSIPKPVMELSREKTTIAFLDGDRGGSLNLKSLMETAEIDFVVFAPEGKEVEELSKKEVYKSLREKMTLSQFLQSSKIKSFPPKREKRIIPHKMPEPETKEPETRTRIVRDPRGRYERKDYERKDYDRKDRRDGFRGRSDSDFIRREPRISDDQRRVFKKTLDDLIGTRAACIFDASFNLMGKVPVKELMNVINTLENPYAIVFDGRVDYRLESLAKRKGIKFLVAMESESLRSSVNIVTKEDLK